MPYSDLSRNESDGIDRNALPIPAEDHVILHPCFRYIEVKMALAHISAKIGLVEQTRAEVPYIFYYTAPNLYLHVTTSPFRYDSDHLCYGFQFALVTSRLRPSRRDKKCPYVLSEWHTHPLMFYLDLSKRVLDSDSTPCTESLEPWKLLQEQPLYLNELLGEDSFARKLSREERDLVVSLDSHGFEFSTFSEMMSLAFWKVPPAFLDQLARYGYTHFSVEELCSLWRKKVPIAYLKAFADRGCSSLSAEEYLTYYSLDVDPASVV